MNSSIREEYQSYPIGFWDENKPVYSLTHESYFNTISELDAYCASCDVCYSELCLVLCTYSGHKPVPTSIAAII
jgi:hypothetical protein